jgi:ribosomal protein L37AE/L43A
MKLTHRQHRKSECPRCREDREDREDAAIIKAGRCGPFKPLRSVLAEIDAERDLRLALQRKCRERGYPFTNRMLEVANFIAPAFPGR